MKTDESDFLRLNNYLYDNYSSHLTIECIKNDLNMSESTIYRLSSKHYGHSCMMELNRIRLHHAMQQIKHSDQTIMDIAMQNGFPNVITFNRQFKKAYGNVPTFYRIHRSESTQRLEADFRHCHKVSNPWNRVINVGPLEVLLQKTTRDQILLMKEECNTTCFRFWNLFADWLLIEDFDHRIFLRFDIIDEVLDFFVNKNLKPFIELALKKEYTLDSNTKIKLALEQRIRETDLISYTKWKKQILSFLDHIINRYGRKEVETWIFEINQPVMETGEQIEKHFSFYEEIVTIFKRLLPRAKIGGGGLAFPHYCKETIENIVRMKKKPDFLSMYYYRLEAYRQAEEEKQELCRIVEKTHAMMKEHHLEWMPVYFTEWNLSISQNDRYNDSMEKAVDLLEFTNANDEAAEICGYNVMRDYTIGVITGNDSFCGGRGLFSQTGICKPSFFAMKFICGMGTNVIAKGEYYRICRTGNVIQCLIWNKAKEEEIEEEEKQFDIRIRNVPDGGYVEKKQLLTDRVSDYFKCCEEIPDSRQFYSVSELSMINYPIITIRRIRIVDGTLAVRCKLPANSYVLYNWIAGCNP